jgi:hypothetical protein
MPERLIIYRGSSRAVEGPGPMIPRQPVCQPEDRVVEQKLAKRIIPKEGDQVPMPER